MTTHMTLHVKQGKDWVYTPDALTEKWGVYDSMRDCMSWKGKLKDVINHDAVLIQCVSPEVKAKFDYPKVGEEIAVVEQPELPPETDYTGYAVIAAVVILVLCWRVLKK